MRELGSEKARLRERAVRASRGGSSEVIHARILQWVQEKGWAGTVADLGAGQGILTRRLFEHGAFSRVTGVDFMEKGEGLPQGIDWVKQDLNAPISMRSSSLDGAVAAEVIEHLENPRAFVRECARVLRPGGTLLLSTPNNESWRAMVSLLARGHFVAFTGSSYPAHITALLREDLARILSEAGFSHIEFRFTDEGCVPGFTRTSWQGLSLGMLRGLRYSDNLMVHAIRSR